MQEFPDNGRAPVSQWSTDELRALRTLAEGTVHKTTILRLFPNRTVSAVKVKLSHIRKEIGAAQQQATTKRRMEFTMLDPADEGLACDYPIMARRSAERGNAKYLAALGIAA